MITIRQATADDLLSIQHSNLLCLPENYMQKYFMFHLMSWPGLSFVAVECSTNRVVGYVLAKMDEDHPKEHLHGHITSLAVERKFRRRGIAQRLMELTCQAMIMTQNARFCSLHVRASNRAAYTLYTGVLEYEMIDREERYYADGEDGLLMRKDLVRYSLEKEIQPADMDSFYDDNKDKYEALLKFMPEKLMRIGNNAIDIAQLKKAKEILNGANVNTENCEDLVTETSGMEALTLSEGEGSNTRKKNLKKRKEISNNVNEKNELHSTASQQEKIS